MITITLIGLDPYAILQLSKDLTPKLADIYETTKDKINFYSPDCLYVHDGVEQNDWNLICRVNAPKKVSVLEHDVVHILKEFLKDYCINMQIVFYYYSADNYYEFNNDDYPRFITESNSVVQEDEHDHDHCDCEDCDDEEEESEQEIFLGNVFEGVLDK